MMSHSFVMESALDHHSRPGPVPLAPQGRDHDIATHYAFDPSFKFPTLSYLYPNSLMRGPVGGNLTAPAPSAYGVTSQFHTQNIDDSRFYSQDIFSQSQESNRLRNMFPYALTSAHANPPNHPAQIGGQIHSQPAVPSFVFPPTFTHSGPLQGSSAHMNFADSVHQHAIANNSPNADTRIGSKAPHHSQDVASTRPHLSLDAVNTTGSASGDSNLAPTLNSSVHEADGFDNRGQYVADGPPGVPRTAEPRRGDDVANTSQVHSVSSVRNATSGDHIHSGGDHGTMLVTRCSRCKKEFLQAGASSEKKEGGEGGEGSTESEPRIFKLCHHCRELQRQRSRRWQKKTKDKLGACRRCGVVIPPNEQKYVLCPQCRRSLRVRKANRAAQGKCVHCLGPIQIPNQELETYNKGSVPGQYKVCQRCRDNDKIRRTNLERMGNCNRCAKALLPSDQGVHKVCSGCRQKKKKLLSVGDYVMALGVPQGVSGTMLAPNVPTMSSTQGPSPMSNRGVLPETNSCGFVVPPMSYVSLDQGGMMIGQFGGVSQGSHDYSSAYGGYLQPNVQQLSQLVMQPARNDQSVSYRSPQGH